MGARRGLVIPSELLGGVYGSGVLWAGVVLINSCDRPLLVKKATTTSFRGDTVSRAADRGLAWRFFPLDPRWQKWCGGQSDCQSRHAGNPDITSRPEGKRNGFDTSIIPIITNNGACDAWHAALVPWSLVALDNRRF